MVLPTSPKSTSYLTMGPVYRNLNFVRSGYVQTKPYNLVLPYTYVRRQGPGVYVWDNVSGTGNTAIQSMAWYLGDGRHNAYTASQRNLAVMDARVRWNRAVSEQAQVLVSLAERKQAMDMMNSRIFQLYRGFRHLARFEFGLAANAMLSRHDKDGWDRYHHSRRNGKFKSGAKHSANNYLELHYGWMPLLNDISTATRVLSAPVKDQKISAKGRVAFKSNFSSSGVSNVHSCVYSIKCSGLIRVVNPNLFLANQLGLLNPALAVADVIKYSFLLDYVVNLSEFLGQFTDHAGLSIADLCVTEAMQTETKWTWPSVYSGGNKAFSLSRRLGGLPSISLAIRKPWQLSPRRGAALASLLVQQIPDDPKTIKARRLVTRSERGKYAKMAALFEGKSRGSF